MLLFKEKLCAEKQWPDLLLSFFYFWFLFSAVCLTAYARHPKTVIHLLRQTMPLSFKQPRKTAKNIFFTPERHGRLVFFHRPGDGRHHTFAEGKQTYTLSDRGTYLAYKYWRTQGVDLDVLCEGDAQLKNEYGLIPVSKEKFPHVKYDLAKQFAKWITSSKGQGLIGNYKLHGKQLFYPDFSPMKWFPCNSNDT